MKTGLVFHENYLNHLSFATHPENPARVKAIIRRLQETRLMDELIPITPYCAAFDWIYKIHSPGYLARTRETILQGEKYLDSFDTEISEQSFEVALLAVGGLLAAVDAVMAGTVNTAFCAVRPPGHHATFDRALGFCIFNNVAIAAKYAQESYHLERILIIDWDVHHGNGTQDAFYQDPTVFYFSVHQAPHYPGTGQAHETGMGAGTGSTLNVPLQAGCDDDIYLSVFNKILLPSARAFQPDFIFISAGFDAHASDPLAGMKLSSECFGKLTRIVYQIAAETAQGRIVSSLEGGYDLTALAESVEYHIQALKND